MEEEPALSGEATQHGVGSKEGKEEKPRGKARKILTADVDGPGLLRKWMTSYVLPGLLVFGLGMCALQEERAKKDRERRERLSATRIPLHVQTPEGVERSPSGKWKSLHFEEAGFRIAAPYAAEGNAHDFGAGDQALEGRLHVWRFNGAMVVLSVGYCDLPQGMDVAGALEAAWKGLLEEWQPGQGGATKKRWDEEGVAGLVTLYRDHKAFQIDARFRVKEGRLYRTLSAHLSLFDARAMTDAFHDSFGWTGGEEGVVAPAQEEAADQAEVPR